MIRRHHLRVSRRKARSLSGHEQLVRVVIWRQTYPFSKRCKAPENEHGVREQQQAAASAVRGEGRRRRQLGHIRGRRVLYIWRVLRVRVSSAPRRFAARWHAFFTEILRFPQPAPVHIRVRWRCYIYRQVVHGAGAVRFLMRPACNRCIRLRGDLQRARRRARRRRRAR